jgi:hypothetical protein
MRLSISLFITGAIVLSIASTCAQDELLLYEDFEADTGRVISGDPAAELGLTHDPELVFEGGSSLQLRFVQASMRPDRPEWGFPGALILPLPQGAAGLNELSFALRSELPTAVVVTLIMDEDGSRHNRIVWSPAEEWQEHSLRLDEFILDRDGPPAPEGGLDPARVTGIALIDAQGIARLIAESTPLVHVDAPQEQTLWLDDLTLRATASTAGPAPDLPLSLADFSPPMRGFLPLGGTDLRVSFEEQADGEPALALDYTTPPRTLFGVILPVARDALADASAIRFHARTNRAITLVVTVEERREPGEPGKSRYESTVRLEPSDDPRMITLPLSLFTLGEDQTDPDGALNPELVEALFIVDATAAFEDTEVINTLRLTEPLAVK